MITVTHLDGTEFVVNCDHILTIERTPDTIITLTNGQLLLVREPVVEVIVRTIDYRRLIYGNPTALVVGPDAVSTEGR